MGKIINSKPEKPFVYIKDVFQGIGISISLAQSELRGRAVQTWFGYFINLVQILIATSLYWLIFGIIIKVDTAPIPYPIFALSGIISWQYFSGLVQQCSSSLINNQHLISKIYFPRILLSIGKIFPGLIDFTIAWLFSLILMFFWQLEFHLSLLLVPGFLFIIIFSGLAIGLWTASMSIRFRDLSHIVPHLIAFGFFITPVFFPTTIVPQKLEFILFINPIALAIEGIRWAMFGTSFPNILYLISLIPMFVLFIWGWSNIRRKEKTYADII